MKKVSNLIGTIALAFVALFAVNVHAEVANVAKVGETEYSDLASAVQNANGNPVVLTANVELDSTLIISTNNSLTIDLNGHTITAPNKTGYAIDNQGTLTIVDNSPEKTGEVIGNSGSAAIRNAGVSLTVDGIKVTTKFIGIKNEEKTSSGEVPKLVVKNTTIDKENLAGVGSGIQLSGTATIENVTFYTSRAGSHRFISVLPGLTAEEKTDVSIKDVKISRGKGHLTSGDASVSVEGTAEISLENIGNLGLNLSSTAQEKTTFEPAADTVEKVFSEAKSIKGAKVVVPEDYEGEIPESEYITYVNESGNEVVFVTYKGVRYEVKKGESWTTNQDLLTNLQAADDDTNKHFVKFVRKSDGQQVTGGHNWTESDTVYAIYTITVTFNGNDYTLELGKDGTAVRIGNAVDANDNRLDDAMDAYDHDKYVSAHYYDANGNEYTQGTQVSENVVITGTTYLINVTLNGKTISLLAGNKVSDSSLLKEEASKDHFYYFVDEEGNKYNLNSVLSQNVKLTAIFSVTVKVAPVDGVSEGVGYKVEEGTTLGDILKETWGSGLQAYLDAEGFIKFVDEDGNEVKLTDSITSDMNLRAIYSVVVRVAPVDGVSIGVGYRVEPGTTLGDILKETWGTGLQAYLDAKGFIKFVDANGNEVGLATPITSDLDLVAVYKVAEVPENPNTFDGITSSVVMMVVSLVALVAGAIASKKSFNE